MCAERFNMATLTAAGHNALEDPLRAPPAVGKRKKVALVACIRKLATMPNAIAKNGSSWDQSLHQT